MRILLVSTYDIVGGAGIATYRLHKGLQKIGMDSHMLVQFKKSHDDSVHGPSGLFADFVGGTRSLLDRMPLWKYPHPRPEFWSLQWLPNNIVSSIRALKPDVVHLHWIARGFVPISSFSSMNIPLAWTLHDMWGLTGGCHYDQDCGRWQDSCGICPQLNSTQEKDQSRKTWEAKKRAWKNLPLWIVSPSQWLANCARKSALFQNKSIHVIPNGIDTETFYPMPKEHARTLLGLPQNKSLILFGADYKTTTYHRKGFQHLRRALQLLSNRGWKDKASLVIFGDVPPDESLDVGLPTILFNKPCGKMSLTQLYSAADVFAAPSQQDNLPNTILEAMACGTPCVAFDIGGMPDMIIHQTTGFIAKPFDAEDLAHGLEWVIEDAHRHRSLCAQSRERALSCYSTLNCAQKYADLYRSISRRI